MKLKIASLTIFILVFGFGAIVIAAENQVEAGCSNATLKGAYGMYRAGTTAEGPIAAVGITFYDGKGQAQLRQKVSINGTHHANAFSFEYSLAKDCTYRSFSNGTDIATGVVVDNGNRIFLVSRTPGNTIHAVLEKIQK